MKKKASEQESIFYSFMVVISVICGFFITFFVGCGPMSDEQFERCEQIAHEVSENGLKIGYIPDGYVVEIEVSTITVTRSDKEASKLIAERLPDGQLNITKDYDLGKRLGFSILISFLLFIVTTILHCVAFDDL